MTTAILDDTLFDDRTRHGVAIFRHALEALGIADASTCLMVGDNHDADIQPAQALGMATFHVCNRTRAAPLPMRRRQPPTLCGLVVAHRETCQAPQNETMPIYRPARSADLKVICAQGEEINPIHHRIFLHVFAGPGSADRDLAHWASFVDTEGAQTFVAEEGSHVVGFVTVNMANESHTFAQSMKFGRVGAVSVTAALRGQGIGPALMRLAQGWVKENGGHEVRLNVWAFNEHATRVQGAWVRGALNEPRQDRCGVRPRAARTMPLPQKAKHDD